MTEIDEIYTKLNHLIDRELGIEQPPLSPTEKTELRALQKRAHELGREKVKQEAIEKEEKSREMKRRRGRGRYGEARLAKKVGGVVVGRSKAVKVGGKWIKTDCQKPPDVVTEVFSFESKWLKNVPAMLHSVMMQAVSNAPKDLTPVGVIGDREQHIVYYIMCEKDWISWHGGKK